jgi:4-oxalocrotonate tautomerase
LLEGRTPEQKNKIAEGITKVMEEHAKSTPSQTYVVFDDVAKDDWAIGGQILSRRS